MKKLLFVFALLLAGLSPALAQKQAQTKVIYAEISETVSGDPTDLTLTFKAVDDGTAPAESFDKTTGVGIYSLPTSSVFPNYTNLRQSRQTGFRLNIKKAVFDSSVADARPTSTRNWFYMLENLKSIEGIENLNTSEVTRMDSMFCGDKNLISLDVSNFDTQNVTDMTFMFYSCSSLESLDVAKFKTNNVRSMQAMFFNCGKLKNLDVSNFDTRRVTNMASMFYGCSSLTSLAVNKFITSRVTNMGGMFSMCSGLTSLAVNKFDTSKVTDMSAMFSGCSGLTSIDVSGFDVGKIARLYSMFYGCSSLSKLDISNWKLNRANFVNAITLTIGIQNFATNCTNLKELDLGPNDLTLFSRDVPVTDDALGSIGKNDKAEDLCRITFSFNIRKLSSGRKNNRLIIDKTNPMPPYYEYFGGYFYCAEKLDCDKNLEEAYTPVAKANTDLWQPNRALTTNDWNTLVVPVALTREQLEQSFGTGVQVCRLVRYSDKKLYYKNVVAGESIPANEPVLVKPAEDIKNIGYANVNIEVPTNNLTRTVTSDGTSISFIGTYKSRLDLTDQSWMFYDTDMKSFVSSDGTAFIRKTRAYVTITGAPVNSLKVAIDDNGVTNDINSIDGEVIGQPEGPAYNLSGQRVGDDYKGIVIVNGKKVLRK